MFSNTRAIFAGRGIPEEFFDASGFQRTRYLDSKWPHINVGATRRQLAAFARTDLEAATPALVAAIRHGSGQSAKVEASLWSCWNGALCDALAGLDANLANAVVAMIAARCHLAGDADNLLRKIIQQSGSQPPTAP